MPTQTKSLDPILRIARVTEVTGVPMSSVYYKMANGTFPRPVKLGPKAVGWRQSDIAAWLEAREIA